MITLDDVQSFEIKDFCFSRYPCIHRSTVTLKDGRQASASHGFNVWSIISNLANEKINPQGGWDAEGVKEHFKQYNVSRPEFGWVVKPADVVLNEIFAEAARG